MKLKHPKLFWMLWILAFLVYEGTAIFNGFQGDTFSEFWWNLFRINEDTPLWMSIPIHVAIVGFGVWLIGHLGFGWWGGPGKLPKLNDQLLNTLSAVFRDGQRRTNGKFASTNEGVKAVYDYLEEVTKSKPVKDRVVSESPTDAFSERKARGEG